MYKIQGERDTVDGGDAVIPGRIHLSLRAMEVIREMSSVNYSSNISGNLLINKQERFTSLSWEISEEARDRWIHRESRKR